MNISKTEGKQKYGLYIPESNTIMYIETTLHEFKNLLKMIKGME